MNTVVEPLSNIIEKITKKENFVAGFSAKFCVERGGKAVKAYCICIGKDACW